MFFYSNEQAASQRLATLMRYVVLEYASQLDFARVQVVNSGEPVEALAERLRSAFSLDATPGVLFYDNVGDGKFCESPHIRYFDRLSDREG